MRPLSLSKKAVKKANRNRSAFFVCAPFIQVLGLNALMAVDYPARGIVNAQKADTGSSCCHGYKSSQMKPRLNELLQARGWSKIVEKRDLAGDRWHKLLWNKSSGALFANSWLVMGANEEKVDWATWLQNFLGVIF